MLPEPCDQNREPPGEEVNSTGNFPAASVCLTGDAQANAASLLVKESIWSRRLYTPPPAAYRDLMVHLGKELAQIYDILTQETLPETWSQLLRRLR